MPVLTKEKVPVRFTPILSLSRAFVMSGLSADHTLLVVAMRQGLQQLSHDDRGSALAKGSSAGDLLEELLPLNALEDEVDMAVVLERVEHGDDVLMAKPCQDLGLPPGRARSYRTGLWHDLHGAGSARRLDAPAMHGGVAARAQLATTQLADVMELSPAQR